MNLNLLFAKLLWGDSAIILHADLTRLRRILSFVANIPRAVLGTRVNPDACRIRAGTGKFDLNTDFFFAGADFKSIWIQKYYVLFIPFKRCPRQREGHKIKSFCYHFFSCRVMKSY